MFRHTAFILRLLLLFFATVTAAQTSSSVYVLHQDTLSKINREFALGKRINIPWKFTTNDSSVFADPSFNDSSWREHKTFYDFKDRKNMDWQGVGWFRLHIRIDSSLRNKTLVFSADHFGASEIYINGKRAAANGIIGKEAAEDVPFNPSRMPIIFYTAAESSIVIAVRYSDRKLYSLLSFLPQSPYYFGFTFVYSEALQYAHQQDNANSFTYTVQLVILSVLLALGLSHLIVSMYHNKDKANLYYAFFAITLSFSFVCGFIISTSHRPMISVAAFFVQLVALGWVFTFFAALMHTISYSRLAGRVKLYGIISFVIPSLFYLVPALPVFIGLLLFILITFIDSFAALYKAMKNKTDGIRIILAGAIGFASLITFSVSLNIVKDNLLPVTVQLIIMYTGFLSIPLAMSIYLARSIAKANAELENKIEEAGILSARALEQERKENELRIENERKSAELEGARKIQLAMLPSSVPDIQGYDIAFSMRTAAEVGGDFYDYNIHTPSDFTFVLGDATGHGVKAGIMVTAAKTIFTGSEAVENIPEFFRHFTKSLKQLNFGLLYLSLTLIRIRDRKFTVSSAGMPPVLHYRSSEKTTVSITNKGMPLGKFDDFPYTQSTGLLEPGDILVLMSDGITESFNADKVMLGIDAPAEFIRNASGKSAEEIVAGLNALSEEWSRRTVPADDISLVVIKAL